MSDEIEKCYRVLDLKPDAKLSEIKQSYRDLVRIWHPDRFPNDSRVREKAQEHLKEINLAYEKLRAHLAKASSTGSAEPVQDKSVQEPKKSEAGAKREFSSCMDVPPEPPPVSPPKPQRKWSKNLKWGIALGILAVLGAATLFLLRLHPPKAADSDLNSAMDHSGINDGADLAGPASVPSHSAFSSSAGNLQSKEAAASSPSSKLPFRVAKKSGGIQEKSSDAKVEKKEDQNSFTLGSTKEEVLSIQGTPDTWTKNQFTYGYSTVQFKQGRVVGWSNSVPNLKVRLLPSSGTVAQDHFTIGSPRNEVISVQGTPDVCTENVFTYGYSTVLFKDGQVTGWSNSVPNLKVRLLPEGKSNSSQDHFTVGSTRDEVLSIQGTPDSCTENDFSYGYSVVHFKDGKVQSWDNSVPPLKARLTVETEEE